VLKAGGALGAGWPCPCRNAQDSGAAEEPVALWPQSGHTHGGAGAGWVTGWRWGLHSEMKENLEEE
jgi:hypothetical protein